MPYCLKCGTPTLPGTRFCKACGAPVWTPLSGSDTQPPNSAEKPPTPCADPSGYAYNPARSETPGTRGCVRCTQCGGIVPEGMANCPACGMPAIEKETYSRMVEAGRLARDIRSKHGAGALFSIWISLLILICVLVLLLMIFAHVVDASLYDFIENTLPKVLLVAVPLLLLLFLMIWGISRSNVLRRVGMTSAQYRKVLNDVNTLPGTFFDQPGTQYEPGGKATPKAVSHGSSIALLSVALVIVLGITVWVEMSGNDWSFTAFTNSSSDDSSSDGGQLSGRWEGQVIGYTTDSHGITLVQDDAPAIVFRGDKAYWGSSRVDDESLIGECEGWEIGITTYTISNGRITFTDVSSGTSQTYKFDGTTIYCGEYEIQRVD